MEVRLMLVDLVFEKTANIPISSCFFGNVVAGRSIACVIFCDLSKTEKQSTCTQCQSVPKSLDVPPLAFGGFVPPLAFGGFGVILFSPLAN